jgi:hypothetical protein
MIKRIDLQTQLIKMEMLPFTVSSQSLIIHHNPL